MSNPLELGQHASDFSTNPGIINSPHTSSHSSVGSVELTFGVGGRGRVLSGPLHHSPSSRVGSTSSTGSSNRASSPMTLKELLEQGSSVTEEVRQQETLRRESSKFQRRREICNATTLVPLVIETSSRGDELPIMYSEESSPSTDALTSLVRTSSHSGGRRRPGAGGTSPGTHLGSGSGGGVPRPPSVDEMGMYLLEDGFGEGDDEYVVDLGDDRTVHDDSARVYRNSNPPQSVWRSSLSGRAGSSVAVGGVPERLTSVCSSHSSASAPSPFQQPVSGSITGSFFMSAVADLGVGVAARDGSIGDSESVLYNPPSLYRITRQQRTSDPTQAPSITMRARSPAFWQVVVQLAAFMRFLMATAEFRLQETAEERRARPLMRMWIRKVLRRVRRRRLFETGLLRPPTVADLTRDPVLALFPSSILANVIRQAELHYYFPNEAIVYNATMGEDAYLLCKGLCRIIADGVTVASVTQGDVFGTLGMVAQRPRMATVTAQGEVYAWRFHRSMFAPHLAKVQQKAASMITELQTANIRQVYNKQLSGHFLQGFPLFNRVSSAVLAELMQNAAACDFKPREVIWSPNLSTTDGKHVLLLRGHVQVTCPLTTYNGLHHQGQGDLRITDLLEKVCISRGEKLDGSKRMSTSTGRSGRAGLSSSQNRNPRLPVVESTEWGEDSLLHSFTTAEAAAAMHSAHAPPATDSESEDDLDVEDLYRKHRVRQGHATVLDGTVHVAHLKAPLLINCAGVFTKQPCPLVVTCVDGGVGLLFEESALKGCDPEEVAQMRRNAHSLGRNLGGASGPSNLVCDGALLVETLFHCHPATDRLPMLAKLSKALDKVASDTVSVSRGDTIVFAPSTEFHVAIITSGTVTDIQHPNHHQRSKFGNSGGCDGVRRALSDSSDDLEASPWWGPAENLNDRAGSPTGISSPWAFPPLPLVFCGTCDVFAKAATDVEMFTVSRGDLLRCLARTLTESELATLVAILTREFHKLTNLPPSFSEFGVADGLETPPSESVKGPQRVRPQPHLPQPHHVTASTAHHGGHGHTYSAASHDSPAVLLNRLRTAHTMALLHHHHHGSGQSSSGQSCNNSPASSSSMTTSPPSHRFGRGTPQLQPQAVGRSSSTSSSTRQGGSDDPSHLPSSGSRVNLRSTSQARVASTLTSHTPPAHGTNSLHVLTHAAGVSPHSRPPRSPTAPQMQTPHFDRDIMTLGGMRPIGGSSSSGSGSRPHPPSSHAPSGAHAHHQH